MEPYRFSSPYAVTSTNLYPLLRCSSYTRRAAVDRRFNRARYDATRTVEGFSTRLRDEIDLDTLSTELLTVVDETVQPTQASLWLRPVNTKPPSHPQRSHKANVT
jgi:hypothetical protein